MIQLVGFLANIEYFWKKKKKKTSARGEFRVGVGGGWVGDMLSDMHYNHIFFSQFEISADWLIFSQ